MTPAPGQVLVYLVSTSFLILPNSISMEILSEKKDKTGNYYFIIFLIKTFQIS